MTLRLGSSCLWLVINTCLESEQCVAHQRRAWEKVSNLFLKTAQCWLQLVDEAYQRWLVEEEGVVDDITAVVVKFIYAEA